MDNAHLLRPTQLASYLGISLPTLARWRLEGAGPSFLKIGSRVAYRREAVDQWLAKRERSSTSERSPRAGQAA